MEKTDVLVGYSDREKGAYLGAIASIATSDRSATREEIEHLRTLARVADLSHEQENAVVKAAEEMSAAELKHSLDVLKDSKLKYSLIADIITFAKVDGNYTDSEKTNIKKIASYLNVDPAQFSLLDQFVDKAAESQKNPDEVRQPAFFDSVGLKDKFESAGINIGSLGKGLLGMLGPMVLGRMLSGKQGNQPRGVDQTTVPSEGTFGGLGSIFSMFNKGGSKGLGNLLPKIFK